MPKLLLTILIILTFILLSGCSRRTNTTTLQKAYIDEDFQKFKRLTQRNPSEGLFVAVNSLSTAIPDREKPRTGSRLEMVEYTIAQGADVNSHVKHNWVKSRFYYGQTLLTVASNNFFNNDENLEIIKILLKNGANLHLKNNSDAIEYLRNKTPLESVKFWINNVGSTTSLEGLWAARSLAAEQLSQRPIQSSRVWLDIFSNDTARKGLLAVKDLLEKEGGQTTVTFDQDQDKRLFLPLPPSSTKKPQAAVAPIGAIGDLSEAQKQIIYNNFLNKLSKHYDLISQEKYLQAEERAFAELDAEQCTDEQCIRFIQEELQIERIFFLQMIREGSVTQLSLSLNNLDDKYIEEDLCEACKLKELYQLLGKLVHQMIQQDVGSAPRSLVVQVATIPTPSLLPEHIRICKSPTAAQRKTLEEIANRLHQTYSPGGCKWLYQELKHLVSFDLHGKNISDISPLQTLTNLVVLNLRDNRIEDVTPLKTLTNLTHLNLRDNRIEDVTPLKTLTNLTNLNLRDNRIKDVTPLQNLTNLTQLYLRENQIEDVSALQTLTNLRELSLKRNRLKPCSPKSLRELKTGKFCH